jgi:hypothetical protein
VRACGARTEQVQAFLREQGAEPVLWSPMVSYGPMAHTAQGFGRGSDVRSVFATDVRRPHSFDRSGALNGPLGTRRDRSADVANPDEKAERKLYERTHFFRPAERRYPLSIIGLRLDLARACGEYRSSCWRGRFARRSDPQQKMALLCPAKPATDDLIKTSENGHP